MRELLADAPAVRPEAWPRWDRRCPFPYRLFGLAVDSDVWLPLPESPAHSHADLAFRRVDPGHTAPAPTGELVASMVDRTGAPLLRVWRAGAEAWIWCREIATFHVRPAARRVDIYVDVGADEQILALLLTGLVSVFVLHQLGHPTLHASAVVTEQGAVAFLGPKGQGKSTLSALFLRKGSALLTDDVLRLDELAGGVHGVPSVPYMKLWPQTATGTLRVAEELPEVIPGMGKRFLALGERFQFADRPTPLRAFYVLERYAPDTPDRPDVTIRGIGGQEALTALLQQISFGAFLQPVEIARFLGVYTRALKQAPVRVLRYPDGFAHLDDVYHRVIADAAEVGRAASPRGISR